MPLPIRVTMLRRGDRERLDGWIRSRTTPQRVVERARIVLVATETILHQCEPRHRRNEFLRFMSRLERQVPKGLGIHVILDNYATHKTPEVATWLRRHPRVHFHCTPTSASWLNLVERLFSELTTRQLRRLAVTSVDALEAAIHRYMARRNATPTPFTWTASVKSILANVKKANETLASVH